MSTISKISSNLHVLMAIFVKDLRHALRYPGQIIFVFLIPFFLALMMRTAGNFIGGQGYLQYFSEKAGTSQIFLYQLLGGSIWILSWLTIDRIGSSLREERIQGTLEQTYLAPVNRFAVLAAKALVNFTTSGLIFIIVIAASILIIDPSAWGGLVPAFLALCLGLIPLYGIGFIFSGLVVRFKEPYAIVNILNLLFSILIGTYYPITILPYWAQFASRILPQTYALESMRQILLANSTLVNLFGNYVILSVMAIVYPLIGYYVFKLFLAKATVNGDLSRF